MISPCVKKCEINRDGICSGCHRTLEHIRNWSKYPMQDRMAIMESLKRSYCPSCGRENKCAIENGKSASACWCMHVDLNSELDPDVRKSCLCKSCLSED